MPAARSRYITWRDNNTSVGVAACHSTCSFAVCRLCGGTQTVTRFMQQKARPCLRSLRLAGRDSSRRTHIKLTDRSNDVGGCTVRELMIPRNSMARYRAPRILPRSWEFRLRYCQRCVSGLAHTDLGAVSGLRRRFCMASVTPARQCKIAANARLCLADGSSAAIDARQAQRRQHHGMGAAKLTSCGRPSTKSSR